MIGLEKSMRRGYFVGILFLLWDLMDAPWEYEIIAMQWSVVHITELAEDLTVFKNCVDPGENSEDGIFLAHNLMEELKLVEKESPIPMEEG
jgi:hypothetical protein